MATRYRRSARLTKTAQFSAVFGFRCVIRCSYFSVFGKPGGAAPAVSLQPRLGMTLGRKVACRAVDRNYMKRVIREVFRRRQNEFVGVDFVVAPRRIFGAGDFRVVQEELLAAMKLVREKCLASCKA